MTFHQTHSVQPVQPCACLARLLTGKQLDSDLQRAHRSGDMQCPQDRLITPHKVIPTQIGRRPLEEILEIGPKQVDHEHAPLHQKNENSPIPTNSREDITISLLAANTAKARVCWGFRASADAEVRDPRVRANPPRIGRGYDLRQYPRPEGTGLPTEPSGLARPRRVVD